MASQRRARNRDEEPPQSAAKRRKTAPHRSPSKSKQPNASSRNRALKTSTTAKTTPSHATTTESKRLSRPMLGRSRKPAPTTSPAKPKPRDLLSLPLEIKQQIFLCTSARDTARLRRVCKALDVVIRGSTKYLAKQFSRKEMERIRQQVGEFASLPPPTDFNSLMKALRVWIKQRGLFEDEQVQWQSSVKLMAHLLNRRETGVISANYTNMNIVPWATVAAYVIRLHQDFGNGKPKELLPDQFFDDVTGLGLLDYNDCDKFIESAKHPELRLSGRLWPFETREQTTFPNVGRMTPLLQYPVWSEHEVDSEEYEEQTEAFVEYLFGTPTMPLLEATDGNMHLIHYLRLPALPNEVSCYYLDVEWARKQANKLFNPVAIKANPVRVSPLLTAAILAEVMLF